MTAVDRSSLTGRTRLKLALQAAVMAGLVAVTACSTSETGTASPVGRAPGRQAQAAANPDLDPGSSPGAVQAPGFRLVNQFGQPMSLR